MNLPKFFEYLRKKESGVFGSRLSENQVMGTEKIIDAFNRFGDGNPRTLAYALATAYHEVGGRMLPVREGFASSDAAARRIVRNRKYGQPAGLYGHVYYGRGFVQLTWLDNYARTGKLIDVDLVKNPDRALEPTLSARILIEGLIDGRWNGQGKGIGFYLHGKEDLKNARRTVNITDKWQLIAGYYRAFLAAIEYAGGLAPSTAKFPDPIKPKPKTTVFGALALLFRFILNLFKGK